MQVKVTFIGLGIMGKRMAQNLLQNGVDLTVFNRSKGPVEELVKQGAKTANSLSEAVQSADIVFTMLSTPEVVEAVALGEEGFLRSLPDNALWVDCSTVHPAFSVRMGTAAEAQDVRFLDAPVAGTKPHAEKGELVFFVGGAEEDLTAVQELMEHMGRKVLHIGARAAGAKFKMLVNGMLAQSMVLFSETLILGEKMGLDQSFLLNALPNLVVAAPFTKAKAEMIRAADYEVQFPLEWMHKDLHLLSLTAYEYDQPLYLANLTKELFAEAKQKGLGRLDFAAIHQLLAEK